MGQLDLRLPSSIPARNSTDLRGEQLKALDEHADMPAELARLGVADVRDHAAEIPVRRLRRIGPEYAARD
jgi:hypothetical protein